MGKTEEKKNMVSAFIIIMALCLYIGFLTMSFSDFVFGFFSMTWSKTQGMVLEKSIIEKPAGPGTLWKPMVKYAYTVEGEEYTGEKISFSMFIFGKQWASDIVNKYNSDSKIDVFYNPFNHKTSCLKPGPGIAATVYTLIGIGGIFYLLFPFYKNRRKSFE